MKPGIATLSIICVFSFSSGASTRASIPPPSALYLPFNDTILPSGSLQPILTTLNGATLRIVNDSSLANYTNIVLDWELKANGTIRQKGSLTNLPLVSKRPAVVRLPFRIPPANEDELVLVLRYHYPRKRILAQSAFQLTRWSGKTIAVHPAGDLSFSDSNNLFTIQSPAALLRFDKQTGWLQTWQAGGISWTEDTPACKSRFQPSDATDTAASSWKEAGRAPHLQLFSTSTGTQLVIVRAEYTLPETSCLLHLSYTINASGEIQVDQFLEADTAKQGEPLPCFGMYWTLPAAFDSITVYGPTPSDPTPSLYHIPVTPSREISYPDIRTWTITDRNGKGIRVTADSTLLTIGTHTAAPRLTIDHPAPSYPLPYHNYRYSYKIAPQLPQEKKPIK